MAAMQSFSLWFLENLPSFFMSEPIVYVWSFALLAYIFKLILSLRS